MQNKINQTSEPKRQLQKNNLSKSAVLSSSGLKSFVSDSIGKNNPYFPQIYGDEKQIFAPGNKMTGIRAWNGQATQAISLGKGNAAYFPKWGG